MVEEVSVKGQAYPFFERAGMTAVRRMPDAKTIRMAAALEAVGIDENSWHNSGQIQTKIEQLAPSRRTFIDGEMERFCQKFSNRRRMPRSLERTDFVLSKLAHPLAYCLWTNPDDPAVP